MFDSVFSRFKFSLGMSVLSFQGYRFTSVSEFGPLSDDFFSSTVSKFEEKVSDGVLPLLAGWSKLKGELMLEITEKLEISYLITGRFV